MRNARHLSLKREALAPLSSSDMSHVVGGSHYCGVTDFCADTITHGYTFDACGVPTLPINECVRDVTSAIAIRETLVCL